MSIWHHEREVIEHSDGSKTETRYDPDTGKISGIEIYSATGKTRKLTYYYREKPAYRIVYSEERSDCHSYIRRETWFGIHDVYETISVICKDKWVKTETQRRYLDGNLTKEVSYSINLDCTIDKIIRKITNKSIN